MTTDEFNANAAWIANNYIGQAISESILYQFKQEMEALINDLYDQGGLLLDAWDKPIRFRDEVELFVKVHGYSIECFTNRRHVAITQSEIDRTLRQFPYEPNDEA